MMVFKCICLALLANLGSSLEPVTIALGGIIGLGSLFAASWLEPVRCRFTPCCNNIWIITNFTGLQHDIRSKLHGQHLASSLVVQHVEAHFMADNPSKALVLSFHGPTGVGKTFVSNIIAENMYKGGLRSNFVHLISAMRDFPHQKMISLYQNQLRAWIQGNVTQCERSTFIFEEVDKLPAGFLDVLVPYVEYQNYRGIDYRKAVFIFLSNTGSSDIVKATFNHWKSGKSRETLPPVELEMAITKAISEDNEYGLWQSQLMSKSLINAYIPFLPLEKVHVTACIRDALSANNNLFYTRQPQKIMDDILKQLTFSPLDDPVFSDMGCKRATEKIYEAVG